MKVRPCCQCSCWSGSTTSASSAYACAWRRQYDCIWAKKWFKKSCSFLLPPWRELKCLAGMGCSPHPHSSLAPKHIAKVRCLRWEVNTLTFQLNSNSFDIPLTVCLKFYLHAMKCFLDFSSYWSPQYPGLIILDLLVSPSELRWEKRSKWWCCNHLQWFAVGFFGIWLEYVYIYNYVLYMYKLSTVDVVFLKGILASSKERLMLEKHKAHRLTLTISHYGSLLLLEKIWENTGDISRLQSFQRSVVDSWGCSFTCTWYNQKTGCSKGPGLDQIHANGKW